MFEIDYSVMVHYPSLVSKDCITLALLFFNKTTKESNLVKAKNWNRIRSFNTDLDIELIKLQLEGIDDEIHHISKDPNFYLAKYTKFYVNDLKFTNVISTTTDDFEKFIGECAHQYLIFDFKKSERPTVNEQLSFIKKYLKTESIKCENKIIKGYFNENVAFDFIINDYAFKLFRFEGRSENRLISSIKDWAYNAIKLRGKYKVIFITDVDFKNRDKFNTIYNILQEESYKIINFNEVLNFIQSIDIKSDII
ncbi:MAG: hypothetical protein ACRC68_10030 [Clostridium sp.]